MKAMQKESKKLYHCDCGDVFTVDSKKYKKGEVFILCNFKGMKAVCYTEKERKMVYLPSYAPVFVIRKGEPVGFTSG